MRDIVVIEKEWKVHAKEHEIRARQGGDTSQYEGAYWAYICKHWPTQWRSR